MKVRLSNGEFIELSQAQREAILSALGHDLANKRWRHLRFTMVDEPAAGSRAISRSE